LLAAAAARFVLREQNDWLTLKYGYVIYPAHQQPARLFSDEIAAARAPGALAYSHL
jgi:hypothetical protein